ncbi:DUF1963 domain-containing protein [Candidatus Dojkabacteria bacterium]|nr:DUF1963 domain-containing protein [Candidatus Dojkabacteria bacterium]
MKRILKRAIQNIGFLVYIAIPGSITWYIWNNNPSNPSIYLFGAISLFFLFGYISTIFFDSEKKSNVHEDWYQKEKESRKLKAEIYNKYKEELDKISKPAILIDKVKPLNVSKYNSKYLNRSKYGGLPALRSNIEWPINTKNELMPFIGQVNFTEVNEKLGSSYQDYWPKKGVLLLFADTEEMEYKTIFTMPIVKTEIEKIPEQKIRVDFCLHEYFSFFSLPENSNEVISPLKKIKNKALLKETEGESDYVRMSIHVDRLFGYQSTIQGVDVRRKIISNKADFEKWILLWEVTDDYRDDFYMDTCGHLYVFIEKEKLIERDFSDLRVCYDFS